MLPSISGAVAPRLSVLVLALAAAGAASATTIRVPADQPTIQSAINAAVAGDEVLVAPGTYNERIDFLGKPITVISEAGAEATTIDAQSLGPVATFINGETRRARLSGFTLTHGNGDSGGGGAYLYESSPTIDHNRIVGNKTELWGGGLYIAFSSPNVHHNLIANNAASNNGGGMEIGGFAGAVVTDNVIENNQGGGIEMWSAGTPMIARNIIRYNTVSSNGGGVVGYNDNRPTFVDNLVYGNQAISGGGLYLLIPSNVGGGSYINNTFADNVASNGSEVYLTGFSSNLPLANNVFRGSSTSAAVHCDDTYDANSPKFEFNDTYSSKGAAAEGTCATSATGGTNRSVNPLFVGKGDQPYRLRATSELIDAGSNSAASGIKRDLLNKPRVVDGGHGATVDIGAYEYRPK